MIILRKHFQIKVKFSFELSLICLIFLSIFYSLFSISNKYQNSILHLSEKNNFNQEFDEYLKLIIEPKPNICQSTSNQKFIFAYIFTKVSSFEKRNAIRNTWANKTQFPQLKISFIVALSKSQDTNNKLVNENILYGDILQGNFIDAYKNLSYKSLIAWEWITSNCLNAKYILKIDDDVVLNTFALMNFLKDESYYFPFTSFNNLKNAFICRIVPGDKPCMEKSCGKMYTSNDEYNEKLYGLKEYGRFCSGVGFLMTSDLVASLLLKSYEIKLFWIDDVYVGILGRYTNANFLQLWNRFILINEINKLKNKKDIMFIRDVDTIDRINTIWNNISFI